jgi:hypothetical protein
VSNYSERWPLGRGVQRNRVRSGARVPELAEEAAVAAAWVPAKRPGGSASRRLKELGQGVLRRVHAIDQAGLGSA